MVVYAGWQLSIYYRSGSGTFNLLDGIQRITYDLVNNVEPKEECGNRYPTYVVEGIYGTTGTIERYYTGSGTWALFETGQSQLPLLDILICPAFSGSGRPYVQLNGLKMNKVAVQHKPGANLMMETWDWIGTGSLTQGVFS